MGGHHQDERVTQREVDKPGFIYCEEKKGSLGDSFAEFNFPEGLLGSRWMCMKGERGASQIAARKILVRCMDTIIQNFSVEVGQHRNKLTKEGVEIILWRF